MKLSTSQEDLNAMLTLTNFRKWVESWPNKYIGIRNSCFSCPIGMYLNEGNGVVRAEVFPTKVTWINVDNTNPYPLPPPYYIRLPLSLRKFIFMVDKGSTDNRLTSKIQKTTVLKYIDRLMKEYGEGDHVACHSGMCYFTERGSCQELRR